MKRRHPHPPRPDNRSHTRLRIEAILDGHDRRLGRSVAFAIQFLVVISVISIALVTLPGMPPWVYTVLNVEEWVIVVIFTIEYALRIYAARSRLRYIFSFYGLIDLVSILPTLLMSGLDVRSLRALRALRILRLFKLMRYISAFQRLGRAISRVADELIVFAGIASIVLYFCATAIYYFEHNAQPESFASIPHALWWAIVTLTTVGYGDVYPITTGGRIFTGMVLILALGIIAVPTGLLATALSEQVHAERHRERANRLRHGDWDDEWDDRPDDEAEHPHARREPHSDDENMRRAHPHQHPHRPVHPDEDAAGLAPPRDRPDRDASEGVPSDEGGGRPETRRERDGE